MITEWPGLVEASEEKGWADGVSMREMEPMLPSRDAPEAYDAYVTAYWHGYVAGIKARVIPPPPRALGAVNGGSLWRQRHTGTGRRRHNTNACLSIEPPGRRALFAAPWVFFEMVNEPTAWGQISTYTAAVKSGLKIVYDAMRAAAPDTAIVFLSAANLNPSASQYLSLMPTFDSLGNGQPIDWNKTVFGFHYYNNTQKLAVSGNLNNATDNGEAGLRSLAAVYPMFNTETNWYVEENRLPLVDAADMHEDIGIAWTILRTPGQTSPVYTHSYGNPPLGPAYLDNKVAQLRARGYNIPVE